MSNKQRVVLVTGGMGGLGETISTKMVDAGYRVVVTYSPGNTKHAQWVDDMKARGYDILAVACDVSDFAVDILVNNAGITRDTTFKKMDKISWDVVMRTNLDSLFNMTKQVADGMVAALVQGMRNPQLTPILPLQAFGISAVLMVGVCIVASALALARLRRLEPAMVFR